MASWNRGKKEEFRERRTYDVASAAESGECQAKRRLENLSALAVSAGMDPEAVIAAAAYHAPSPLAARFGSYLCVVSAAEPLMGDMFGEGDGRCLRCIHAARDSCFNRQEDGFRARVIEARDDIREAVEREKGRKDEGYRQPQG